MSTYRFTRRSFLAATGAAVGLHTLLYNAEAQAQGTATVPKRLLVTHHPLGTCRYAYTPAGSGTSYTTSRILQPFEDAALRQDMIVIDGLNMDSIAGTGGGHEKGTVVMMTGTPIYATRGGELEADDAMAAGPSVDQLLLYLRPQDVGSRPLASLYAICHDIVDFAEISTRCFRYGMQTQSNPAVYVNNFPAGITPYENIPLRPTLRPLDLYREAFGSMMPGGATDGNGAALLKARAAKKSVLDFSLREIARLRTLAPASQKPLLDAHEAAIRAMEKQLDTLPPTLPPGCGLPSPPPDIGVAPDDGKAHNVYGGGAGVSPTSDRLLHQQIGEAHQAVIRAAFQCDLTRVALFQWAPGQSHVAFDGMHPAQPGMNLMHHPVSHRIANQVRIEPNNPDAEFLVAVEVWYNARLAEFLNTLKSAPDPNDPNGGTLFDNTVVPYFTEVADCTHVHRPMPLALFGGKMLGFRGGQYLSFSGRPYNDLWLTILQSFGVTLADLQSAIVNGERGATLLRAPYQGVLENVLA